MKVKALVSTFVGLDGQSVFISEGDEYEHDSSMVQAHPDKFSEPPKPEPKRTTRRG